MTGAITKAIEALEMAQDSERRKSINRILDAGFTPTRKTVTEYDEALAELRALKDSAETEELYMAVYGEEDTQEARNIKHKAAKLLSEAVGD